MIIKTKYKFTTLMKFTIIGMSMDLMNSRLIQHDSYKQRNTSYKCDYCSYVFSCIFRL